MLLRVVLLIRYDRDLPGGLLVDDGDLERAYVSGHGEGEDNGLLDGLGAHQPRRL